MKNRHRGLHFLAILFLAISGSAIASIDGPRALSLQKLHSATGGKIVVSRNKEGSVSQLRITASPISVGAHRSAEAQARAFLADYGDLFLNSRAQLELKTQRVSPVTERGVLHVRLQQHVRGIPIRGAEVVVHLNRIGVTGVESSLFPDVAKLKTNPSMTAKHASVVAAAVLRAVPPLHSRNLSIPRLEFINVERLRGGDVGQFRLAWSIEVTGGSNELIWVDAIDGQVLLRVNRIAHALARDVEDISGQCVDAISSYLGYSENGTTPVAGTDSADAIAAWDHAKSVYDYFHATLARDGVNGLGANGTVMVNVCDTDFVQPAAPSPGIENALFNPSGTVLEFATGMAVDDLVGHEYTHAVAYYSIPDPDGNPLGLLLTGQSGAIAESLADIFGETVDVAQASSNDSGQTRWKIGEAATSGPFRDLMNPNLYNMPGKVTDTHFYCGDDDEIAIHVNSGVLSHAFALLVDGGSYNGMTITGIGFEKAAKIYYRALTEYLTSTSSFLQAYNALLNAASDLVMAGTITTNDQSALSTAIAAVELNVSPCSTKLSYCPAGSGAQFIFRDNFETTNSGNWTSRVVTGAGVNHWIPQSGTSIYRPNTNDVTGIYYGIAKANSGNYALWADNSRASGSPDYRLGDSAVEMASAVAIPLTGDVRMQFEHHFDFYANIDPDPAFSSYQDGGVLEYSINGGVDWIDAKVLFGSGTGYAGAIQPDQSNPLAGREAFVSTSAGYTSTQLNLVSNSTSLAGQSVKFRFRMGTDRFNDRLGWLIDDVVIYACSTPAIVVTADPDLQTAEDGSAATFTVKLAVAPTGPVKLSITSDNVGEGVVSPGAITFTPENWNQGQAITATGVADNAPDGDQSFGVTIAVAEATDLAGFATASAATVTITNRDNGRSGGGGGGSIDGLLLGLLLFVYAFFCDLLRNNIVRLRRSDRVGSGF